MIVLLYLYLGACVGSFLALVYYRHDKRLSIISPRSFCEECKQPLKWSENLPIFSFIFLKGSCSNCKAKISKINFLSEVLGIIFFSITLLQASGGSLYALKYAQYNYSILSNALLLGLFFSLLWLLALMDAKYKAVSELWLWLLVLVAFVYDYKALVWKEAFLSLDFSHTFAYKFALFVGILFVLKSLVSFAKNWRNKYEVSDSLGDADLLVMGCVAGIFGVGKAFYILFLACVFACIYFIFKRVRELSLIPFILLAVVVYYEIGL